MDPTRFNDLSGADIVVVWLVSSGELVVSCGEFFFGLLNVVIVNVHANVPVLYRGCFKSSLELDLTLMGMI